MELKKVSQRISS